jgi:hypothetical protein
MFARLSIGLWTRFNFRITNLIRRRTRNVVHQPFEMLLVVHKRGSEKENKAMRMMKNVIRLTIRKPHQDGSKMIRLIGHLKKKYHRFTSFVMHVRSGKQIKWVFICFGGETIRAYFRS